MSADTLPGAPGASGAVANRSRRRRRVLIGAAIFLGLAAVLHVPIAKKLGGGCPFKGQADLDANQRDALRVKAVASLAGTGEAMERPALEMTLGETHRGELTEWARAHGSECGPGLDRAGLACKGVRLDDRVGVLYADFDAAERLVALSYSSKPEDAAGAAKAFESQRVKLAVVGEPTHVIGRADADYLGAATMRQSRAEYRRENYFASITATNLGESGYLVSEVYRAIE